MECAGRALRRRRFGSPVRGSHVFLRRTGKPKRSRAALASALHSRLGSAKQPFQQEISTKAVGESPGDQGKQPGSQRPPHPADAVRLDTALSLLAELLLYELVVVELVVRQAQALGFRAHAIPGAQRVAIGARSLIGAEAGVGIALGDECVVEAGLYVTAGTRVTMPDGQIVKARELSGASNILFRRNSVTGTVEARPNNAVWGGLNEVLHSHN